MASLATIPTMFLGADVLGMRSIALARYSKAPTSFKVPWGSED